MSNRTIAPSLGQALAEVYRLSAIFDEPQPKVTINEVHHLRYGRGRTRVGSFKRKAKGREYTCPRILLRDYFNKYVGKDLLVLEGSATIENMVLGEMPVLLLFIKPEVVSQRCKVDTVVSQQIEK